MTRILLGPWCIRSYRRDDARALVKHADNPKVASTIRDRFPSPYTPSDADAWLDRMLTQDPETCFAIASSEELIGGIGLEFQVDVHRRTAEIGYWLGEEFWGRGIATAAVRAFTRFAFESYDVERLFAGIFETNPASVRVLEKAGYRFEGRLRHSVIKQGATLDELLYARVRDD